MTVAGSISVDSPLGTFLSIFAIIASILTALGSLPTILRIKQQKSTQEYPALPYFSALTCSALWLTYGLIVVDTTIIASNVGNVALALFYTTVYCIYSSKEQRVVVILQSIVSFIALIGMAVAYYFQLQVVVSITAMVVFILFLVSPLSVLYKVIETKSCQSLPFELPCAVMVNGLAYALYGYLVLDDVTLWGTGLVTLLLASIQLCCHVIYGNFVKDFKNLVCYPVTSFTMSQESTEKIENDKSIELTLETGSVVTV